MEWFLGGVYICDGFFGGYNSSLLGERSFLFVCFGPSQRGRQYFCVDFEGGGIGARITLWGRRDRDTSYHVTHGDLVEVDLLKLIKLYPQNVVLAS